MNKFAFTAADMYNEKEFDYNWLAPSREWAS